MLSQDLKGKVLGYVSGDTTAADLEQWTIERMQCLLSNPESADADVASAIEQGLTLMSDDILTEAEFRELLSEALAQHSLVLAPLASVMTSSSNQACRPCCLAVAQTECTIVLTCLS